MKVGTASWMEGTRERRAVVAPLPSDPGRVVDLNRVERIRLGKLGEGRAEGLAEVLVPSSLRQVLEGGTRALARLRQTLAYAEKWHGRGTLPEGLAPRLEQVTLLPCLPRPVTVRRLDGSCLDRLDVRGPGAVLRSLPRPTFGLVGIHGGRVGGLCLGLEDGEGVVLGAWVNLGPEPEALVMRVRDTVLRVEADAWDTLKSPRMRAGEVVMLPPPVWALPGPLPPGGRLEVSAGFECLSLSMGKEAMHPTVQ